MNKRYILAVLMTASSLKAMEREEGLPYLQVLSKLKTDQPSYLGRVPKELHEELLNFTIPHLVEQYAKSYSNLYDVYDQWSIIPAILNKVKTDLKKEGHTEEIMKDPAFIPVLIGSIARSLYRAPFQVAVALEDEAAQKWLKNALANPQIKRQAIDLFFQIVANQDMDIKQRANIITKLLNAGIDVNTKSKQGNTPYTVALTKQDAAMTRFLKSKGGKLQD